MAPLGHVDFSELDPVQTLAIARASRSFAPLPGGSSEVGREGGTRTRTAPAANAARRGAARRGAAQQVSVAPDDWGFDPVKGELVFFDDERIALQRKDPQAGSVRVHFPHDGFVIRERG